MVKFFGILNITPDSFSDGGDFLDLQQALDHADKLFSDGADYIDVGAQSTNPFSPDISWEVEWGRLESILPKLLTKYPGKISLDTLHSETARNFLELGGTILNDVSGFINPEMIEIASNFELVIINHFPGRNASEVHEQKMCSMKQVRDDLLRKKEELIQSGVDHTKIIIDPGIGFGKTMQLNKELLEFSKIVPSEKVMIGYSRKRFLGEKRFEIVPNIEAGRIAIKSGAKYLRIHEVGEHGVLREE